MTTRISGDPGKPGAFAVPASDGDGAYTVIFQTDALVYCPCPGMANHGHCRHERAVRDEVHREAPRKPLMSCAEISAMFDR